MSKSIQIELLDCLKKSGRSTCFGVKIVAKDGTVKGFCSLDDKIRFNDGQHDVVYDPAQELFPQNMQNTVEVSEVDNTELHGIFDDEFEQLMLAGKFFQAEITIYRFTYLRLNLGAEVVQYGTLGKIDYQADSSGVRKLEWHGLDDPLKTRQNDVTSLTCRNEFGDDDCKMPFIWEAYTVAEVDDPNIRFRVVGPTHPDALYFVLGVVLWTSGANNTADLEIEDWEPTADGGWVKLSFVTPYQIAVNDHVNIRRDCDKTETTCKGYNNIINMDAEHLMPVQDAGLMIPGAYIKSNNAI